MNAVTDQHWKALGFGRGVIRLMSATKGRTPCQTSGSPDAWFSDDPYQRLAAMEACGFCHCRALCLETAQSMPGVEGVWGGVSFGRKVEVEL